MYKSSMKILNFNRIKRYSILKRKSKVNLDDFATVWEKGGKFSDFLSGMPGMLKSKELFLLADNIIRVWKQKKLFLTGMGAHVIKCGLSPLFIDLMKNRLIDCICLNGAGAIHDFEIAFCGSTSEDVQSGLEDGSFGMAEETGKFINRTIIEGNKNGFGFGKSVGTMIKKMNCKYKDESILYNALKYDVPVTVHVAIGTDIIHQHPEASGKDIGAASFRDFQIFTTVLSEFQGGVFINFGSAVIIPEVFLKALTVVRNLGFKVKNFTTANFDMIEHYRPLQNIVKRPTEKSGRGFKFLGHHEIMIPLLFAILKEKYD